MIPNAKRLPGPGSNELYATTITKFACRNLWNCLRDTLPHENRIGSRNHGPEWIAELARRSSRAGRRRCVRRPAGHMGATCAAERVPRFRPGPPRHERVVGPFL